MLCSSCGNEMLDERIFESGEVIEIVHTCTNGRCPNYLKPVGAEGAYESKINRRTSNEAAGSSQTLHGENDAPSGDQNI